MRRLDLIFKDHQYIPIGPKAEGDLDTTSRNNLSFHLVRQFYLTTFIISTPLLLRTPPRYAVMSNSLIPAGARNLIKSLNENGKPMTVIYNDGIINYDTTTSAPDDQKYIIYNAPGGQINLVGSYKCSRCHQAFGTSAELDNHSRYYGHY